MTQKCCACIDVTQGVLDGEENKKFQHCALALEKSPKNNIILQHLFYKQWSSKYIENPINFPGIFMLFVSHLKKFQSMLISSHGCDVDDKCWKYSQAMKVLGVKIDDKLNFTEHISDVSTRAGRQLNILQRLKKVLDYKSRMAIYKSFIMSNFNYYPIVWMFTFKKSLDRIENIK